jgi:uncharacterized membrane protein
MKTFLALYGIAASTFLIIDSIWLTTIANGFYKDKLGKLLAAKPDLIAAGLFYAIYIFAMVVFVIKPGVDQSLFTVAWKGALLGLAMYATYDLTNQATLKDWPRIVTMVDLVWGTCITAVVSVLTVFIYTRFVS